MIRAVRLVATLLAIAMLAACTSQTSPVHPGLPAARAQAVSQEALPVTVALPAPVASCTNAKPGWSTREEALPGVAHLPTSTRVAHIGSVVGYLDSSTAVCGQILGLHLSTRRGTSTVTVSALRIGSYQGRGARLIWQSGPLPARHEPAAVATGPDRFIQERWPVAATVRVDATWPPGFYLLDVAPAGGGRASEIPLVVRSSGVRAPYLLVASDLTWLAYNAYGGRSLYFGSGATHTRRVANRSYVAGADRPVDASGLRVVVTMTLPLVRFLARQHFPYDVTTDSSLDATPSQLQNQTTVVLGGHSEYWTHRMYEAALLARDRGTNFAFLGANEIYWQGRIERDTTGQEDGLTVYRRFALDRLVGRDHSTATVRWRDYPLTRDPAQIVGIGTGSDAVGVTGDFVVATTPRWLFAGTHLHKGSVLALAIGNEGDAQEPTGGFSPSNLQVLLEGDAVPLGKKKPALITDGYYTATSGAGIFAAGTTFWVCDLDRTCPKEKVPATTSLAVRLITSNLLKDFAHPRAGLVHPSVATSPITAQALSSHYPPRSPDPGTRERE